MQNTETTTDLVSIGVHTPKSWTVDPDATLAQLDEIDPLPFI